jgi:DNA-binding transcriptional LysR family regulator
MDTKKSIVLLSVLDKLNITEAAKCLGYTPSGVSRIIESIEKELGFSLLIRTHSGVYPTAECTKLLPLFSELASLDKALTDSAQEITGMKQGKIRIGNAYTAHMPELFDALQSFKKDFPQIDIQLYEGLSSELVNKLTVNKLDLCICSKCPGDYDWIPLFSDPMCVMVSQSHPLAKESHYPLKRLETDSFIDFRPDTETDASRLLQKYHIKPNRHFAAANDHSAYLMVKAGMGVALTNTLHTRTWSDGISVLMTMLETHVPIGIAVINRQYLSPSVKIFLERFTAVLKGSL